MDVKALVRDVPDFPKEGILFRDITPVLLDGAALRAAVDQMAEAAADWGYDVVAGPESRGFIFGVPLSYKTGKGFIPVRKAGKLPYKTVSKAYGLEYGEAVIEIHADAINPGDRILIVDDLLATGGTCKALCELIEERGGIVAGCVFLLELADLNGRDVLSGYNNRSIVKY